MAKTNDPQPESDTSAAEQSAAPTSSAAAPGGHNVDAGAPVGEATDISEFLGATEGAPTIEMPAPMYWMRSEATGAVFPAFNLAQYYELENNGCAPLKLDETPDGMPTATGMAGTGLLA